MPASFLERHRSICNVLEELRTMSIYLKTDEQTERMNRLINEAKNYAERMSAKLVEYKNRERSED